MKETEANDAVLLGNYDVIVCGGGPAGCAAAIASAKQGASTLLIEKDGYFGGAAVSQMVCVVLSTNGVDFQGIWHVLVDRLQTMGAMPEMRRTVSPFYPGNYWHRNSFDPERAKQVWDSLLSEAGVEVLHFCTVIDVLKDGDSIAGVVGYFRGNKYEIMAKRVIDASGNGDVAHLAGCTWHRGVKDKLWPQEVSLNLNQSNSGQVDHGGPGTLGTRPENLGSAHLKKVDPLDPVSVTRAVRALRNVHWNREYKGYLVSTAADLGVRTSRIIEGIDALSDDDTWNFVKREDGIARTSWEIDIHLPDDEPAIEKMFHSKSDRYAERAARVDAGEWSDIPYGAIVAKDVDNLLVAGRIVSSGYLGQGSLRIQQTCMATGEAAGVAAAMSIDKGCLPRELDGVAVAEALKEYREPLEKVDLRWNNEKPGLK